MNQPKYHVFVCSSSRINGKQMGYCAKNGAVEIIQKMMMAIQEEDLTNEVMLSNTGCLGVCQQGPIMVVYPEGTWYGSLTVEDVDKIVESHFKNGEVVESLEI